MSITVERSIYVVVASAVRNDADMSSQFSKMVGPKSICGPTI